MKVEYIIQNNEISLDKIIENEIINGTKKIHLIVSEIKESGFQTIEEHLIDTKVKLNVYMGINKKNTTKPLLENILEYSDEVYYYDNNSQIEFESNIIVCEGLKTANVYISSGNLSDIFMKNSNIVITKIHYDLIKDKKEYKLDLASIVNVKNTGFKLLTEDDIDMLAQEKVIFSNRQYQHNVKSISDFLGKPNKDIPKPKELEIKEDIIIEIPQPVLNKFEFDIDIDDAITQEIEISEKINKKNKEEKEKITKKLKEEFKKDVKEEEESDEQEFDSKEALSLDDLLFVKSDVKLVDNRSFEDSKVEEPTLLDEEIEEVKVKKIDLNSITSYIYELSSKKINGKDLELLKVPNYVATVIPEFFKLKQNLKEVIDGVEYKSRKLTLEIVDAKNNKVYKDENAKITQKKSQTYFSFSSEYFKEISFEEKDLARIIKINDLSYKIEIVSQELQEYKLWSKMANLNFRNSDSKYGFM